MILEVDTTIYPLDVVQRAAHVFTARCFVLFRRLDSNRMAVELEPRDDRDDVRTLSGEFANVLLDHTLRARIAAETSAIRELIVAQAFCEADLLDRRQMNANVEDDPRGIAQR